MGIRPEEIQLNPEQQRQIAALAEKRRQPWPQVLHEAIDSFLQTETEQETTAKPRRKAGSAKGKVWIAPDFDAPLEEFEEYM